MTRGALAIPVPGHVVTSPALPVAPSALATSSSRRRAAAVRVPGAVMPLRRPLDGWTPTMRASAEAEAGVAEDRVREGTAVTMLIVRKPRQAA